MEIIDGVTIVYFGATEKLVKDQLEEPPVRMYDKSGNSFHSNYDSIERAEEAIAKLKAEGKDAVIGPKAPLFDSKTGKYVPNPFPLVGVYVVKTPKNMLETVEIKETLEINEPKKI